MGKKARTCSAPAMPQQRNVLETTADADMPGEILDTIAAMPWH